MSVYVKFRDDRRKGKPDMRLNLTYRGGGGNQNFKERGINIAKYLHIITLILYSASNVLNVGNSQK